MIDPTDRNDPNATGALVWLEREVPFPSDYADLYRAMKDVLEITKKAKSDECTYRHALWQIHTIARKVLNGE